MSINKFYKINHTVNCGHTIHPTKMKICIFSYINESGTPPGPLITQRLHYSTTKERVKQNVVDTVVGTICCSDDSQVDHKV